jgi:hypothetical protein
MERTSFKVERPQIPIPCDDVQSIFGSHEQIHSGLSPPSGFGACGGKPIIVGLRRGTEDDNRHTHHSSTHIQVG